MTANERELEDHLAALCPEEKRKVLEYVRRLKDGLPPTASGAELVRFAGRIPEEDLQLIWTVIREAREASTGSAQIAGLEEKRDVLEQGRSPGNLKKQDGPSPGLLALAGSLSEEDAREMLKAIEDFERIDLDRW